jgi:mycobactin peptide synthetase MbtE
MSWSREGLSERSDVAGTLHDLVLRFAARTPRAVALLQGDRVVTYAELQRRAVSVARELAARGVQSGHVVPIQGRRCPEFVAALLGVLMCGAAYAVVDEDWPAERLTPLLDQLPSPVRITGYSTAGATAAIRPASPRTPARLPPAAVGRESACAVFFTSGTTASPKGVLVPHAGAVLLFRSCTFAQLDASTRTLQVAPLYWDGLTLELWSTLTTGGSCLLLDEGQALTPRGLRSGVQKGVNLLWLTASLFNLFVDEDIESFRGLRQVLTGGERMSSTHAAAFLHRHPDVLLTNGYGPAEATVFVTAQQVALEDTTRPAGVPLGRALPGTRLLVESEAAGQAGELVVRGERVGLGYFDGSVEGGFAPFPRDPEGGRRYATGDLVVQRGEEFDYVGRRDRELKIHGRRVAPQELEALLEAHPDVSQARAVPLRDGLRVVSLGVFYRPAGTDRAALDRVGQFANAGLPAHLRPRWVEEVEAWPHTPTGKLDERALLEDRARRQARAGASDGRRAAPVLAEDRGREDVLGLMRSALGCGDAPSGTTLRDLGATSLDLLRLQIQVEAETGRVVDVVGGPQELTLADLVGRVLSAPPAQPVETEVGPVALDPVRAAFLLSAELVPHAPSFLCTLRWDLPGPVSPTRLRRALEVVRGQHGALTSGYELLPEPVAVPLASLAPLDVAELVLADPPDQLLVEALTRRPLDTGAGEVLRGVLWNDPSGQRGGFALVVHHVAFDGWSERLLAEGLARAYRADENLPAVPPQGLHPLPIPSAAAVWSQGDLQDARDELRDVLPLALPPMGSGCKPPHTLTGHQLRADLAPGALGALRADADRVGVPLLAQLLTSWGRALANHTPTARIAVGVPVARPRRAQEQAAVGCCINTVPVVVDLAGMAEQEDPVRQVAESLRCALRRSGLPFPELVRLLAPKRTGRTPVYQTMLALQGNDEPVLELDGRRGRYSRPAVVPPVELLLEVWPGTHQADHVTLSYQCPEVAHGTARSLFNEFIESLAQVAPRP